MTQFITSREYKVMLQAERFTGPQSDLIVSAKDFWGAFKSAIRDEVFDTDGSLDEIDKQRTVRFYDSADRHLRTGDYVFRERTDLDSGEREVTLKFRHPDRYIAQDRDMAAAETEDSKTKFEEDIKLPFLKLYSFSTKQPISQGLNLNRMNDPYGLFPDLKDRLASAPDDDEPIAIVRGFTANEVVVAGADFEIREDPRIEAECGLIAWYDAAGDAERPVVVEFSFKYEADEEQFDGRTAERAYNVFKCLGEDLSDWTDPEGPTKTAFVYGEF